MIFPSINLETFLHKYPGLKIIETSCDYCGRKMRTDKPFIEKNYIGLVSEPCTCGEYDGIARVVRPVGDAAKLWEYE